MLIEHKHISFSMFAVYMDTANKLPDKERLMLYDAFFQFAFDEIEPDFSKADEKYRFSMQSTFDQSQASIVSSIHRHEHGRTGGQNSTGKKSNQNARKDFNQVKTKQSNVNENVNDNAHLHYTENCFTDIGDGQPCAPAEGGARSAQKPKKKRWQPCKDENGKYMLKEVEGDGE